MGKDGSPVVLRYPRLIQVDMIFATVKIVAWFNERYTVGSYSVLFMIIVMDG